MFVNNLICLNRIIKKMRLKIINFKIHKTKIQLFFYCKIFKYIYYTRDFKLGLIYS